MSELIHNVIDADAHFILDPITRKLTTESEKRTLIKGSHNSERFTFEIPRYIDGHDMSLCDVVQIHYNNIESKTKRESKDVYEVADLAVVGDKVTFSWLISSNATKYAGSIVFMPTLKCTVEGSTKYIYNTEPYTRFTVSPDVNNAAYAIDEYNDLLESWRASVVGEITAIADSANASLSAKVLEAEMHATVASDEALLASESEREAAKSAEDAESAKMSAISAESGAIDAKNDAQTAANDARGYATEAQGFAQQVNTWAESAYRHEMNANSAAESASSYEYSANSAYLAAKESAEQAEASVESARSYAEEARDNANSSDAFASQAGMSASVAEDSAREAAESASSASTHAGNALISAQTSADYAIGAAESASVAEQAAQVAEEYGHEATINSTNPIKSTITQSATQHPKMKQVNNSGDRSLCDLKTTGYNIAHSQHKTTGKNLLDMSSAIECSGVTKGDYNEQFYTYYTKIYDNGFKVSIPSGYSTVSICTGIYGNLDDLGTPYRFSCFVKSSRSNFTVRGIEVTYRDGSTSVSVSGTSNYSSRVSVPFSYYSDYADSELKIQFYSSYAQDIYIVGLMFEVDTGTVTRYEKFTNMLPAPRPSIPMPIIPCAPKGNAKLMVSGENMLCFPSRVETKSGLTMTVDEDEQTITLNGTVNNEILAFEFENINIPIDLDASGLFSAKIYPVSGTMTNGGGLHAILYFGASDIPNQKNNWNGVKLDGSESSIRLYGMTNMPPYTLLTRAWIYIQSTVTGGFVFDNYKFKYILSSEFNNSHTMPSNHTKFQGSTIASAPCDLFEGDEWNPIKGTVLHNTWITYTLTGEEKITKHRDYDNGDKGFRIIVPHPVKKNTGNDMLCTHYKAVEFGDYFNNIEAAPEYCITSYNADDVANIYVYHKGINTADDLKAFFAERYASGDPVKVLYNLASPLMEQFEKPPLGQFKSYPTRTIVIANYRMGFTFTYIQDLLTTINSRASTIASNMLKPYDISGGFGVSEDPDNPDAEVDINAYIKVNLPIGVSATVTLGENPYGDPFDEEYEMRIYCRGYGHGWGSEYHIGITDSTGKNVYVDANGMEDGIWYFGPVRLTYQWGIRGTASIRIKGINETIDSYYQSTITYVETLPDTAMEVPMYSFGDMLTRIEALEAKVTALEG